MLTVLKGAKAEAARAAAAQVAAEQQGGEEQPGAEAGNEGVAAYGVTSGEPPTESGW